MVHHSVLTLWPLRYLIIVATVSGWNILDSRWTFCLRSQEEKLEQLWKGPNLDARWLCPSISKTCGVFPVFSGPWKESGEQTTWLWQTQLSDSCREGKLAYEAPSDELHRLLKKSMPFLMVVQGVLVDSKFCKVRSKEALMLQLADCIGSAANALVADTTPYTFRGLVKPMSPRVKAVLAEKEWVDTLWLVYVLNGILCSKWFCVCYVCYSSGFCIEPPLHMKVDDAGVTQFIWFQFFHTKPPLEDQNCEA